MEEMTKRLLYEITPPICFEAFPSRFINKTSTKLYLISIKRTVATEKKEIWAVHAMKAVLTEQNRKYAGSLKKTNWQKKVDEIICQFKIPTRRKLNHWCLQKKDSRIQILEIQVSMIEDKETLNNEIRYFEETCP